MAETINIAEIAVKISDDIFRWFKWKTHPLMDENFPCHKGEQHKVATTICSTHPVDVIYSYFDPYLNKTIYLNTDLKSYQKTTITPRKIRTAIKSLSRTIDCANSSPDWKDKYLNKPENYEIRGMLFVYNHDDKYDKFFARHFKDIRLGNLLDKKNQIIHILEPKRLKYLFDVVSDMQHLYANDTFPKHNYSFFYPELYLHKRNGDTFKYAASIELLTSPYMIVSHEDFVVENEIIYNKGYIIYYNREGSCEHEFMYLFDTLSRFQMLGSKIRIRVAYDEPHKNIKNNYRKAINSYVAAWGSDEYKRNEIESISFELIHSTKPNYRPGEIGWRDKHDG